MINSRFERVRNIHFTGIGGSGMCGIAEILFRMGFKVTGSDLNKSANTDRLAALGIPITLEHLKENVSKADAIVISSAIDDSNIEIQQANLLNLPIVPRAVMLGELMRYKSGIAIAGTHGKTTTTSMLATIFALAGLDPTYVIGGRLRSIGSNAYLGKGSYLITEADESDASFIHLQPQVSVVTNIELDHMENYGNDPERLHAIFLQFLHNLPFYGLAVLCVDDPIIQQLIPSIGRQIITYGESIKANYRLCNFTQQDTTSYFNIVCPDESELAVQLRIPGIHNALNATASIAIARDIGMDDAIILKALAGFSGVGRRFEILGEYTAPRIGSQPQSNRPITLVDDYGHHPTELSCTITAARQVWDGRRLVMVFQPHRYSRTRDLFDEFVDVLIKPDILILLNTYAAGEKRIAGFESKNLATSIRQRGKDQVFLANDMEKLDELLVGLLSAGDVLITQGAGNIGMVASNLAASNLTSTTNN